MNNTSYDIDRDIGDADTYYNAMHAYMHGTDTMMTRLITNHCHPRSLEKVAISLDF
jgi:hypothetical protein